MKAEKLLRFLEDNHIEHRVIAMDDCLQIETVVLEPEDAALYHEGTVCVCSADYYGQIRGRCGNLLYFVLKEQSPPLPGSSANLVEICGNITPQELFHKIQDFIHRNFRIESAYSQIGQCLLEGQTIEALLKTASSLLGNPVVLLDISTKALYYSSYADFEVIDDEILQSIMKYGFVTADLFRKYDYDSLLPEIGAMEHARVFYSSYETKLDRINARVMVNNKYFGMIVIPETSSPFHEGDPAIADITANGLSILLEKKHSAFVNDPLENIFLDLLSNSYKDEEEFHRRADGFNWNPEFPIRIVAIQTRDADSQSLLAYRNHLHLIMPKAVSAYHDGAVYLLAEEKSLSHTLVTLSAFLHSNDLAAGFSRLFYDSMEIGHYAVQALEILRIGKHLHPEESVYRFESYMLHHNAYLLKKAHCECSYILPEFLTAREYDADYGTDYCGSVRAWLSCRNLVSAAKAMHIHRNTIVYRLEKFQTITGIDLSKGDDIYKLDLAFHLWDLENLSI